MNTPKTNFPWLYLLLAYSLTWLFWIPIALARQDYQESPQFFAVMFLARIDEKENAKRNRKYGYTAHVYVRPQWRKRGVASALISHSLQVLKEQGMTKAELGVDSENESAAFRLYQSMGYKIFSVDTWFRKSME